MENLFPLRVKLEQHPVNDGALSQQVSLASRIAEVFAEEVQAFLVEL
jgi:hypothetical protein